VEGVVQGEFHDEVSISFTASSVYTVLKAAPVTSVKFSSFPRCVRPKAGCGLLATQLPFIFFM
jgi:hypothetical protein